MTGPRAMPLAADEGPLLPWAIAGAVTGLLAVGAFALLVRVVGRVTGQDH